MAALVAVSAHAQVLPIDPHKVTEDLNRAPLAVICFVEFLVIAWLARALERSYEKRLEEGREAHKQTVTTLSSVITLSLKQTESMDVVDKTLDRLSQRSLA